MCYIFSCFGWILDLAQQMITFCLACWMACVVCCGLIVATAAGVAYGYNYSMAELFNHTRPDVKLYIKRNQSNERTDKKTVFSRILGSDLDALSNTAASLEDYKVNESSSSPLAIEWQRTEDSGLLVKGLDKYSTKREPQTFGIAYATNDLTVQIDSEDTLVTYPLFFNESSSSPLAIEWQRTEDSGLLVKGLDKYSTKREPQTFGIAYATNDLTVQMESEDTLVSYPLFFNALTSHPLDALIMSKTSNTQIPTDWLQRDSTEDITMELEEGNFNSTIISAPARTQSAPEYVLKDKISKNDEGYIEKVDRIENSLLYRKTKDFYDKLQSTRKRHPSFRTIAMNFFGKTAALFEDDDEKININLERIPHKTVRKPISDLNNAYMKTVITLR